MIHSHAAVEVQSGKEFLQLRQVGLPTEPGGRRDEPDGRAPTEHVPLQQPVDEVAVADEVDPLDAVRPVGHAGAREQRIHPAAAGVDSGFDGGPLGQVDVHRLDAGQGDGGDIGDHDLGAGVQGQLGRGAPMPVAPPTTRTRLLS